MQVKEIQDSANQVEADAIVLGVYENEPLRGPIHDVNATAGGTLTKLIEAGEISGKAMELTTVLGPAGIKAMKILCVGLGDRSELNAGLAFRAMAAASRQLASRPLDRVAFCLGSEWTDPLNSHGIAGALVGCQGQDLYRAKKRLHPFQQILWSSAQPDDLQTGQVLGDAVNLARRLVNEPPMQLYPASFAEQAQAIGKECGLDVESWDENRLRQELCGAMLAVAQGSSQPPRLVIARHHGAEKDSPWLALVGKGVTFDSGGLSLKPSDGMLAMKCDMAGAATVMGAMQAIARLKLPVNVIGLMGMVENMPSANSYKLGDVLTARNGRTIEVHNTDAEGRLVLADVLCVAVANEASKIIDLATLTGACVVALGNDVAGIMSNDQPWCDQVMSSANTCGEHIWQLPMFAEYGEQIKGQIADIKNVGNGRWGGAITAAKLLEQFVGDTPWAHIDIAGPAFLEKPKPWLDAGASGAFVRTLVDVANGFQA